MVNAETVTEAGEKVYKLLSGCKNEPHGPMVKEKLLEAIGLLKNQFSDSRDWEIAFDEIFNEGPVRSIIIQLAPASVTFLDGRCMLFNVKDIGSG